MLNNNQGEETESVISERAIRAQNLQETSVDDEIDEVQNPEIDDEIDDVDLTFPFSIDNEDYRGTTLDDAINDKMHPPNTEWPNDIYRDFMEIVTEYQLSNSCGNRLI